MGKHKPPPRPPLPTGGPGVPMPLPGETLVQVISALTPEQAAQVERILALLHALGLR